MIKVYHQDAFGDAVARKLAAARPDCTLVPIVGCDVAESLREDPGTMRVFAFGAPRTGLMSKLDPPLIELKTPWTAAFLRDRHLVTGPLHKPGRGACWGCMRARHLTLTAAPRSTEAERAYDAYFQKANAEPPAAFTSPMVGIAVAGMLDHIENFDALEPGALTIFDCLEGHFAAQNAVPLHGCACRGENRSRGPQRFSAHLKASLREGVGQ